MAQEFPEADQNEAVTVHAELLHRLCLADGLLEVLEWTRQGTGADPMACMWLAGLRWYRLMNGGYPPKAPEPPERPTDRALGLLLRSGAVQVAPGSSGTAVAGLSSGEMAYPSAPAQPEADDDGVLLRLAPLALVPYIDESMRMNWTEQAVCLTHGSPELVARAQEHVRHLHHQLSEEPVQTQPQLPGIGLLGVVVEDLGRRWREVTSPRQ
ncbi:hypothetical protein GCM10009771_24260 [Nesterenkonia flava]